jgi:arginyl-tRNA---protein transferase
MIRLDASAFHPTKDQRQAQNRFNRYILGDAYIKEVARLYPRSKDQAKKRNNEFDLAGRVHEGETESLRTPPNPAHTFRVVLEPDDYSDEKYALYENYQRIVHQQPPSKILRSGFRQFLCVSPLERSIQTIDGQEKHLGSWHQCYYLDDKLVAMGVLDLLPQNVSSVYFIYHESVSQHAFGKLGALREISMASEEGYGWWCAGLYIHTSAKMRYKGDYSPSYLLDPMDNTWHLMDESLRSRLDAAKYYIDLSGDRIMEEEPHNHDAELTVSQSMDDEAYDSDDEGETGSAPGAVFAMLGTLTKDQLLSQVDLDQTALKVRGVDAKAHHLVSWDKGSIDDPHSIKGIMAELVAAIGADLAEEMCVTFN